MAAQAGDSTAQCSSSAPAAAQEAELSITIKTIARSHTAYWNLMQDGGVASVQHVGAQLQMAALGLHGKVGAEQLLLDPPEAWRAMAWHDPDVLDAVNLPEGGATYYYPTFDQLARMRQQFAISEPFCSQGRLGQSSALKQMQVERAPTDERKRPRSS